MTKELESQEILDFIIQGTGETYYISKQEKIARKVMVELVKAGYADFILLRDEEVSLWWGKIYGGVRQRYEKWQEKTRIYELKLAAYEKLTKEERKTLGIRKPTKPKNFEQ